MKKIFDVETPKRIVMGDNEYFKKYKGRKLTSKIVNRKTTRKDCTKVKIEEVIDPDLKEHNLEMTIYIAPKEQIETYMNDLRYQKQTIKLKQINTKSSEFIVEIDDNKKIMPSQKNSWWGTEYTYRHKADDKNILDAIVINISLPEKTTFKEAERYIKNLFH